MGYSYGSDNFPKMCFNAAKSWQLGWYTDRSITVNPLKAAWSGRLVGIPDYSTTANGGEVVLVKINTSSDTDYYMMFNRRAGITAETSEAGDQVVIETQGSEGSTYAKSFLVAKLSAGGQYKVSNFDGSGRTVTITVTTINLAASVAYADVSISVAPVVRACAVRRGVCGYRKCCSGLKCVNNRCRLS